MALELNCEQAIRLKLLNANNPFLLRSGPSGIDTTGSFLPPKRKINKWVVKQRDITVLLQLRDLEVSGANRITVLERIDCRLRKLNKSLVARRLALMSGLVLLKHPHECGSMTKIADKIK